MALGYREGEDVGEVGLVGLANVLFEDEEAGLPLSTVCAVRYCLDWLEISKSARTIAKVFTIATDSLRSRKYVVVGV